jgi:hypothetical protein
MRTENNATYDALVIGGGPSGATTAILLPWSKSSPDSNHPRNRPPDHIRVILPKSQERRTFVELCNRK